MIKIIQTNRNGEKTEVHKIFKIKELLVKHIYPSVTTKEFLAGGGIRSASDLARDLFHGIQRTHSSKIYSFVVDVLEEKCIEKPLLDLEYRSFEELAKDIEKICY